MRRRATPLGPVDYDDIGVVWSLGSGTSVHTDRYVFVVSLDERSALGAKCREIAAFEIQPGIVAFSTFTKDGDICQMTIEKLGYVDAQHSDFDSTIPSGQVDHLVDEVVPPSERGKRSKYLSGDSFVAGGLSSVPRRSKRQTARSQCQTRQIFGSINSMERIA